MINILRKILKKYLIPALIISVLVLLTIKLNSIQKTELVGCGGHSFEKGVVTEIEEDNIQQDGSRVGEQQIKVKMKSGLRKGEELGATSSSGFLFGAPCTVGMHVIVIQSVAGDSTVTSIYSKDRGGIIIIFAVMYLLLLCIIGGRQGARGAIGLIFTFASIIYVYLPMIYLGFSPFATAVFICIITTIITLYLVGGPTIKTLVATTGTIAGVCMAGLIATLFSRASGITGFNVSDIESLLTLWETNDIQVGGLLFSGLLISTLGAVMDVAMSISSSMSELCVQNPGIERIELFKAGMRVGRDMMGTDSNTLILAFAGSSLSMMVMNYAYDLPFLQIINSNNIGIAVMQGLSGSFGVVLSVPSTVMMFTWIREWKKTR